MSPSHVGQGGLKKLKTQGIGKWSMSEKVSTCRLDDILKNRTFNLMVDKLSPVSYMAS